MNLQKEPTEYIRDQQVGVQSHAKVREETMTMLLGKSSQGKIMIDSDSNLVLLMSQIMLLFFNMKVSLDAIDLQAQDDGEAVNLGDLKAQSSKNRGKNYNMLDDDMNEQEDDADNCSDYDDEDEEESNYRSWTHLTCVITQLKREKQTKTWV